MNTVEVLNCQVYTDLTERHTRITTLFVQSNCKILKKKKKLLGYDMSLPVWLDQKLFHKCSTNVKRPHFSIDPHTCRCSHLWLFFNQSVRVTICAYRQEILKTKIHNEFQSDLLTTVTWSGIKDQRNKKSDLVYPHICEKITCRVMWSDHFNM